MSGLKKEVGSVSQNLANMRLADDDEEKKQQQQVVVKKEPAVKQEPGVGQNEDEDEDKSDDSGVIEDEEDEAEEMGLTDPDDDQDGDEVENEDEEGVDVDEPARQNGRPGDGWVFPQTPSSPRNVAHRNVLVPGDPVTWPENIRPPQKFCIHIDLRRAKGQKRAKSTVGEKINRWMVLQGFYDPRFHRQDGFLPSLEGDTPPQARRQQIGLIPKSAVYETWLVSDDFPELLNNFFQYLQQKISQPFVMLLYCFVGGNGAEDGTVRYAVFFNGAELP